MIDAPNHYSTMSVEAVSMNLHKAMDIIEKVFANCFTSGQQEAFIKMVETLLEDIVLYEVDFLERRCTTSCGRSLQERRYQAAKLAEVLHQQHTIEAWLAEVKQQMGE